MSRHSVRLCLWICTAAMAPSLEAVEVVGRVTAVDDQTLKMSIEGEYLPTVGNRILVLAQIPGLNEQALVAQAAVTQVSDDVILGKIDRKTGAVAVGQTVRIDAPEPWNRPQTPKSSDTPISSEIRGRVSELLSGTATVQLKGSRSPNVGDRVDFVRPLNTPDLKVQRVGGGKVREVLGGELFINLDADTRTVLPGDEARIVVGGVSPPAALPPAPPTLPGSLPFTPTRLDWLAVELNAFARIQTLATERFTLMFTPRPTDDTIVIYVRYLPDVNQNDMRSSIREARNIISIITRRRGWDGWVNIIEDVAAM